MKTSHVVLLVVGLGGLYLLMRGSAAPAAVNAGTVAPPAAGVAAPAVPPPSVDIMGSESVYGTAPAGGVQSIVRPLQEAATGLREQVLSMFNMPTINVGSEGA